MHPKAKLFEYAVLYHPKPKKDALGNDVSEKSAIITEVTRVLAERAEDVSILAARSLPEIYLDKLDQVEIVVRPF